MVLVINKDDLNSLSGKDKLKAYDLIGEYVGETKMLQDDQFTDQLHVSINKGLAKLGVIGVEVEEVANRPQVQVMAVLDEVSLVSSDDELEQDFARPDPHNSIVGELVPRNIARPAQKENNYEPAPMVGTGMGPPDHVASASLSDGYRRS